MPSYTMHHSTSCLIWCSNEVSEGVQITCYSVKSLKRKLMYFYGDHIYFSELPGRPNLVCFKDMASFILENFKKSKEQTSYDIIAAAAKIIK